MAVSESYSIACFEREKHRGANLLSTHHHITDYEYILGYLKEYSRMYAIGVFGKIALSAVTRVCTARARALINERKHTTEP